MMAPLNDCIRPRHSSFPASKVVRPTVDPGELQYEWGGERGDKSVICFFVSSLDEAAGLDFVANSSHGLTDENARSFARRWVANRSKR